ncbi:putative transmembrane efflux protein [Serinicoccus hydrothermalis]|uniref:Putative transmembrane efflux protein n=1 Tax=Serinicoccus hydrothermalis TaxID=1758689 RepID=A0A1B1NG03_9MICO|nr:MFS transporter [Serinicoccus hydrothermalis]ANS80366.1 putative transmembrane efflux protein [Serinicoccus hydrothermalis]
MTAEPETQTDAAPEPDPARWRMLAVTLAVGFMSLLDVTIVNVAIPSMRSGLDTSASTIQWVVSGYALTFGLVLVTGGRLGDAWGRRRLMLIGLAGFVLASAACGLAPSAGVLVVARLVQGMSAGLLAPQNTGLIQELFTGAERGKAFGLFGLVVSVASGIGPVLGGIIISLAGEDGGWRWIFLVNVPIGLVLLVAIARMVPDPEPGERDPRLDLLGAVLLGAAVLCLLLPVVALESRDTWALALLVGVPLFAWGFLAYERRLSRTGGAPLLDVALLRRTPGYGNGIVVGTLYFTGFTGVFLVLSVYLQDGLGYSTLVTGLLLTPFAIGSAVSSPWAGRAVSRMGRVVVIGALVVMMSGLVLMVLLAGVAQDRPWLWAALALPLLVAGLGGGAVVSPNFTLTLAEVPPRMGGAAGGALQTGQRVGSAIGAAVLVTAYQLGAGSSQDPGDGLRAAIGTALALLLLALGAALFDGWRRRQSQD